MQKVSNRDHVTRKQNISDIDQVIKHQHLKDSLTKWWQNKQ